MKIGMYLSLALLLCACDPSGVETKKDPETVPTVSQQPESGLSAEQLLEPKKTIVDKKQFASGMKIQWFEKGTGEQLKEGEVYEINFKVRLDNGEVVDGNHLLKRDMIPFMVGYGMQTKGWDMAMTELRSGDFVEIYLPGNLARGKKGVPGLIPPNAPNIIFLRVGKKIAPTREVEGTKVWLLEERADNQDTLITDHSDVALHYFVGTKTNPKYDNSYQRNVPFVFNMKDHGLVPGFRKALVGAKLFDKLWILVPPSQAYGKAGLTTFVKPNESVFYDVIIMEVR